MRDLLSLRRCRAGFLILSAFLAIGSTALAQEGQEVGMSLTSPDFTDGQTIPTRYAYKERNQNPTLQISGVPHGTKTLLLIVDDPDSPGGVWNHWLVWNIPPNTQTITPGETPPGAEVGKNDFGNLHYDGPAPPSGLHRYFFKLYALDAALPIKSGANRAAIDQAFKSVHVLGNATLIGTYGFR